MPGLQEQALVPQVLVPQVLASQALVSQVQVSQVQVSQEQGEAWGLFLESLPEGSVQALSIREPGWLERHQLSQQRPWHPPP